MTIAFATNEAHPTAGAPISVIRLGDEKPDATTAAESDVAPDAPTVEKCDMASDAPSVEKSGSATNLVYDPHEHGNQRRPIRYAGAFFLLLKYIVGTGILAIPYTFRRVGYAVGICGTVAIGLLYLHIMRTLLSVEYELCRRLRQPRLTYVSVVHRTFDQGWRRARRVRPLFVGLMYFNYALGGVMCNAVYLVVMGGAVRDICRHYGVVEHGIHYYLTLLIVPLVVICWIPNLKFLVPFSVLTGVFTVVNVVVILFIAVPRDGHAAPARAVGDLAYFPQFFAVVIGAFSCTGLVLPVKNDMAAPRQFVSPAGVLNAALLLVSAAYAFFGAKGYLKYGDRTRDNVLSNLPNDRLLSVVVLASYAVAVGISFTYCFYVTFDTAWSNYLGGRLKRHPYRLRIKYALKTAINVVTYVLAIVIPNFGLFAALSGSVGILADVGMPPALQIILLMEQKPTFASTLTVLRNCAIVGVAVLMFLSSFVESVRDIVDFYGG